MELDRVSLRVLGALMEKEMTTPEAYPLSLNSLIAAANQKTSREPVMDLSEEQTREALEVLRAHELVDVSRDARVPKYEHRIRTVLNLRRDETALICLLLLRGPQTPGELRGRAERMFSFDDIVAVQAALERLASRENPLVRALARQVGSRETRYTHLLGDAESAPASIKEAREPGRHDELAELKAAILALQERVSALEARLQSE